MAQRFLLAQPLSAASSPLTTTGFSPTFSNSNQGAAFSSIDVDIIITAAPTGTSPTLTVQLYVSLDGVVFEPFGSATSSLNAPGATNLANTNVDYPFFQLKYTLGGTTPSFPVEISVYGF